MMEVELSHSFMSRVVRKALFEEGLSDWRLSEVAD